MPQGHEGDSDQPSPPAISELPEVTTSDAFRKNCTDLTGLCIIAALNPAADDFASQKATFQVCSAPTTAMLCMLCLASTRKLAACCFTHKVDECHWGFQWCLS